MILIVNFKYFCETNNYFFSTSHFNGARTAQTQTCLTPGRQSAKEARQCGCTWHPHCPKAPGPYQAEADAEEAVVQEHHTH